jgi:hypothetical protein
MNQRKDSYRAALQRGHEPSAAPPRSARATTLHSRYVRVTIEVDPALQRDLTRWVGPPVSTVLLAGSNAVRAVAARLAAIAG